jgi:hypothetical protein
MLDTWQEMLSPKETAVSLLSYRSDGVRDVRLTNW